MFVDFMPSHHHDRKFEAESDSGFWFIGTPFCLRWRSTVRNPTTSYSLANTTFNITKAKEHPTRRRRCLVHYCFADSDDGDSSGGMEKLE